MAEESKKSIISKGAIVPLTITAILIIIMALHLSGIINLQDLKNDLLNIFGVGGNTENDAFVGFWQTLSPAIYYAQDIDGERYVEYTANFHLDIIKEGKGYLGNGWLEDVSYKKIPGSVVPITPLVPNPDGSYPSPISFDARGYLEPQPGISSLELSGNKMTITTQLFGGIEKIVLTLVESGESFGYGDKLYVSLSVIPTSSGQEMGEETDTDIVLVR